MTTTPAHDHAGRQDAHVGDMDTLFWRVEKDPLLRNTMTAVFLLDRAPDRDAVLDRMERASRMVPGWRHRLVSPPFDISNPRWIVDPDFDLSLHVRWIGAPLDGTFEDALEFARTSSQHGLDRDRALWSVTVVEGLDDGRAAVLIKLHHVLIDGLGGIGLLPLVVDLQPEAGDLGPMPDAPAHEPMSDRELFVDALATNAERFWKFAMTTGEAAVRKVPDAILHPLDVRADLHRNLQALTRMLKPPDHPLSPIATGRHGWSRFVPFTADLALLRETAHRHEVSINDLFLAIVGHGFARYHEEMGAPVDALRTQIAVSTRTADDPVHGNHVAGGHFVMPLDAADPLTHVATYRDIVLALRDDVNQPLAGAASTFVTALGPLISNYVGTAMKNADLLLSNITGIDVPLWFGGAAVERMYGFGPTMGTATNATLVSYDGIAHLGLNVDLAAITDVDLLTACMQESIGAVEAAGR